MHREEHETRLDLYHRFNLPGFDAHVYVAMAEAPAFFTLPPWGWRVLTPWLVHALPVDAARGFVLVTHGALVLAGGLLFLFLRRLGCGEIASLLGVAGLAFTRPVEAAVAYPFLVEPLTLVLLLALLLALEAGAGAGPLGLLATLCAASKEATLLLLPTVFFARRDRDGTSRALATAVLAAAPAGVLSLVLRAWGGVEPAPLAAGRDAFWLAAWRVIEHAPDWLPLVLLHGILPAALLSPLRPWGRTLLGRYGWAVFVTSALPFVAAVYTGDPSVPFFLDDIPRLLIYAMPFLIALALSALDGLVAHRAAPGPRLVYGVGTGFLGGALALALAALTPVVQDPYRRADLSGPRDGRYVLTFCRESLHEARRLSEGRQVDYDPERRSFTPVKILPELMGRMRWFLRDGWGRGAAYGTGPVVAEDASAALVIPALVSRDLFASVSLRAPQPMRIRVRVNGTAMVELPVAPETRRQRLLVPGGLLFRGDNELRFDAPAPGLGLVGLRLRAVR
jgi:hypothetical protein